MHSIISNMYLPTQELPQPIYEEIAAEVDEPVSADDLGSTIAQLLIAEGHLTPEQLAYTQRVRAKLVTPKTLLYVLQELRLITSEQLRDTLGAHRGTMPLGALLVELGLIQASDLQVALAIQQASRPKKRIGEILVERHCIREQQLAEALSYQLGFPYVAPNFAELDPEVLGLAPFSVYMDRHFVPIGTRDGHMVVAFADPLEHRDVEVAQQYFGPDIILAVATKHAIQEAITPYVQTSSQIRILTPDEFSIGGMVNTLFEEASQAQVSAVHFEPMKDRLRVRFRRDGMLVPHKEFRKELIPAITNRLYELAQLTPHESPLPQEGRVLYEEPQRSLSIAMWAAFYDAQYGKKIVLRLLNKPQDLLNLHSLGMAPKMLQRFRSDVLDAPTGLVLVTGPARMGKTTTLYGCVNYTNTVYNNVVTAEDPVEHAFDGITQCALTPRAGGTLHDHLTALTRHDPDVIVIGALRDHLTAKAAIEATLAGYKVLATLQTEDSIGGLQRLPAPYVDKLLLTTTSVCLVAQRLLPRLCSACAEPYIPTPLELQRLGYTRHDFQEAQPKISHGCSQCRFTGSQGRIGVFELLLLEEASKEALLARKTAYHVHRVGLESTECTSLFEDGVVKAARGLVSLQEVLRFLPRWSKPRSLRNLLRVLGE